LGRYKEELLYLLHGSDLQSRKNASSRELTEFKNTFRLAASDHLIFSSSCHHNTK